MEDPNTASEITKALAKIIDPKTIDKFYEDTLADPLTEISGVATDILKSARLFTAPFQLLAASQDRFARFLDRTVRQVPEENRITAPSHIAGPIFEKLKYLEEDNILTELYVNLLARAIDKERSDEAHPSFITIISLISPDEAMVLYHLRIRDFSVDLDYWARRISRHTFPADALHFPEQFGMYVSHLISHNLIKSFSETITERQQERLSQLEQIEYRERRGLEPTLNRSHLTSPDSFIWNIPLILTDFGRTFVKACVPKEWNLEQL